jgi:peptide/nickel transport system ATP-binding protein
MTPLLEVRGLQLGFAGAAPVVAGLDLSIMPGETVALVGESGSGKTLTALSIMRLLPRGAAVEGGSIGFDGQDVLAMSSRRLNRMRGGEVAMLFQQPTAMLDPSATVGSQVAEAVRLHTGLAGEEADRRVVELFREVGISAPEIRVGAYAHQLSGGMAQRVMIACALAGNPRLLIADEPTTALDVTVQMQILQLLGRERRVRRLSTLLISHDLSVVAALADRILVLYAGRVVEEGARRDILEQPRHPYTQALVRASLLRLDADGTLFAIPGGRDRAAALAGGCGFLSRCGTAKALDIRAQCAARRPRLEAHGLPGHFVRCLAPRRVEGTAPVVAARSRPAFGAPIVTLKAVEKHFPIGRRRTVRSLQGLDLQVLEGEELGLVGESGCGKSTLARVLLGMTAATSGDVHCAGHDLSRLDAGAVRQLHRDVQLVFQDPVGALDPRMRLGESLGATGEPRAHVLAMLGEVGLDAAFFDRLPRECSGGELQRAVIARALLMGPRLLVCDEPTSALDASVRAQILNLLDRLRGSHGLTILLISHDLRVVRHVCDRVAVMYLGEIVEVAAAEDLFSRPAHPYTQALIAASLPDEHGLDIAVGEPPSPFDMPAGCRFAGRCRLADARCVAEHPPMTVAHPGHEVRCWKWQVVQGE